MRNSESKALSWSVCPECQGCGKKNQKPKKKVRPRYKLACDQFKKNNGIGTAPLRPKTQLKLCSNCSGSGLISSNNPPQVDYDNFPHIAIIGGGIGGIALAVGCLHRGIPFTLYERDSGFDARSQGYGLTLQQARKAIEGLGISTLEDGVISTLHVVHTTDGNVIGEWGMRKWSEPNVKVAAKRTNVHIARQSLRLELLDQLGGDDTVNWGHQLVDLKESRDGQIALSFQVNGEIKTTHADLVVGADGIHSSVRKLMIGEAIKPLHYLDCMVILGICPLTDVKDVKSALLDSATVFQTANGEERIYMMPYTSDKVMWQLSFPISEQEAKDLHSQGAQALKAEACRRTQWHDPIPQVLMATELDQISGYPVYDRELLDAEVLDKFGKVTLIGDAAHPMSPFKGQGANQALLDALALTREIYKECRSLSHWRDAGLRRKVLSAFESEMLERSAAKVKDSAAAAQFLHSEIVLHEDNAPRGRCLKNNEL
ncbi:FAD-dependent oxidoreductase [Gelidibacter maritimus]|uniref:FAD-dependent monooxygenase n=1 Tax=Gelidibacter maritimus TaxID=2761487 RepID=A0A7W2M515_9FLAO|nr:NAD(P)/FAD-dependent oxidoreductase [Gelidibacter maritimus]MBA6152844.1 FAD-dependent monooxygenase [Gelidibacter maritimus]